MPYSSTTTISFSDAGAGGPWPVGDWAAALEPPTVLVVDGDADVSDLAGRKLRAGGYRTLIAANARVGMALAVNELPQLIVLDVSTPGLDGLGFCYELHSSPQTAHIPVIIVNGRGEPSEMEMARMVGAEDYLVKPFAADELVDRIERLLPKH